MDTVARNPSTSDYFYKKMVLGAGLSDLLVNNNSQTFSNQKNSANQCAIFSCTPAANSTIFQTVERFVRVLIEYQRSFPEYLNVVSAACGDGFLWVR